ncbi:hypothetical protein PEC301899_10020 [Pectobacterium carotovorum subsp. carotovorum]|nr:hypothetical protein PEC301899_10020 [Pectobacterium carotovorum subsp. carotovorum]
MADYIRHTSSCMGASFLIYGMLNLHLSLCIFRQGNRFE